MRLAYKLLIVAFGLAVTFDLLFHDYGPFGINLPIAEVLFIGSVLGLAKLNKQVVPVAAYVSAIYAFMFSLAPAIWTSPIGIGVSIFGFIFANILFTIFILGESHAFRHPLDVLSSMVLVPARHTLRAIPMVRHLRPEKLTDRNLRVMKGIAIALPILLIFTSLLASADPVFGRYVGDVIKWLEISINLENVIDHIWWIGFFTVLFGLFFAAAFLDRKPGATVANVLPRGITESKVILGLVIALFAVFLLVQGNMLFGGSAILGELNMTYAEYARQGFAQLAFVAMLVLGLVLTLRVLHGEKVDKNLLWLHAILLGETALLLASATSRLNLYIDAYGYTPLRLFGAWFLTVVGILLVLTFFNVIYQRDQRDLMRHGLIFIGIAMFLFTASAPDARSVRLNLERAEEGAEFPLADSLRLSEEAAPAIAKSMHADVASEEEDDRSLSPREHYARYFINLRTKDTDAWQTWNFSRTRARNLAHDLKEAERE